jgi:PcfJ-like protein
MPALTQLGAWLGLEAQSLDDLDDQPDLGRIKSELMRQGVNSRGWRLCIDHGDALFSPLAEHFMQNLPPHECAIQACGWLRVLQACEMDVLPPYELVNSILSWRIPGGRLESIPPLFLRAAWKATVGAAYCSDKANNVHARADRFVKNELVPLAQWFFGTQAHKVIHPDRLKSGWETLRRIRREELMARLRPVLEQGWPPVVQRYTSGPFVLVGLCNEAALDEEGAAMSHCVGSFGDQCRYQPLRIYSVRKAKSGERVATLSVKETQPGIWSVDQLKGPSNTSASSLLWPEIHGLLNLLNMVSIQDSALRSHLDMLHVLDA